VSPQVKDILGYTQEEVMAYWNNFTSDNPINEIGLHYTLKAIETGKRQPVYNLEMVKKNGEKIWVEVREKPIVEDGKVISIVGSLTDITERMEAIQVKESEARFKNMFLGHNATMLLIEPETGAIIDANNAAADFYGYSISKLCSLNINDLNILTPEEVTLERKNALAEKHNHFIFNHRLADGQVRIVEVHSSPIKYQNKQILFSITYDITEREKAKKTIIENQSRLRSLVSIFQRDFHTDRELLDYSLEESIKLTESKIGFICFYDNKTDEFSLYSWSKEAMKKCQIADPQTIFRLENTGIWGDAVREKKPIIINDYSAPNPHKKGTPKGHVKLKKVIVLPIVFNNEIVAVIAVANKKTDYTQ
jgi:PAS domain S-box-containing protein